jgi:hypothetical protein
MKRLKFLISVLENNFLVVDFSRLSSKISTNPSVEHLTVY